MNFLKYMMRSKKRRPATPVVPLMHVMQPLNSYYFLLQVQPLIEYAGREIEVMDAKDVLTEVVLMAYLMGVGYDYHTAHAIVGSWEAEEFTKKTDPN